MDKTANRNTFWAHTLVDELLLSGLEAVVISPGSRSTPLALAFGSQTGLSVFIHPDERGAAFFALGLALASEKPVAVLCTSGTAAANFYPAVVEAHQSQVPLLIMTADRPVELRDSGANQTIDQVKLFGGYVRWAVETPIPEADPEKTIIQALRSLAGRLLAAAGGPPAGPVHLNIPFRKPLEPVGIPGDIPPTFSNAGAVGNQGQEKQPLVRFTKARISASPGDVRTLAEAVRSARRGLIYCGPRCPGEGFPQAVLRLSQVSGMPVFADALSGLRFHPALPKHSSRLIAGYETFLANPALRELAEPDLVLQFGALPISKSLGDFLGSLRHARRVQIQPGLSWADETFNTSDFLMAEPEGIIDDLIEEFDIAAQPAYDVEWVEKLQRAEGLAWQAVAETRQAGFFEGAVLSEILEALEDGDNLFVASSLPVRHLDQFGCPQPKRLRLFANRGASGIDGTIASACGVAASAGLSSRTVLAAGDLAFLHDLNSLLLLLRYQLNISIVLINNNGGGIFRRLPIADAAKQADFEALFESLFTVPHGLSFEHAAQLFQLGYIRIDPASHLGSSQEAGNTLRRALKNRGPQIIEVVTDAAAHEDSRRTAIRRFTQLWQQTQEIHTGETHHET